MLILLSSGARRRYRDDIIRALAHPPGTEFRFRYGDEYVEASIVASVRSKTILSCPALICYLADQGEDMSACIIPCRFATVTRAQLVGTSIILTLSAGAYVQSLDNPKLRSLMTDDERALLPYQGSDAKTPPGKFVFPIAAPLTANAAPDAAGARAFEKTAEALRDAAFGANHPPMSFYAVRDLTEVGSKLGSSGPVISPKHGRYELRSGKRYALDVYSFSPDSDANPSDASTLIVQADDGELKFSSEIAAKLDSRYDLNRFRFTAEQRLLALPTGLRVALGGPTQVDGKTTIEQRCDITLDLRFAGSLWLAVGRTALITIGTAGPAITGAYAAQKGSIGLSAFMLLLALAAGVATVIPSLGKK